MEWTDGIKDEFRAHWAAGLTISQTARAMNLTRGQACGASMRLHLHFHGGKQRPVMAGGAADVEARTRFVTRVQAPRGAGVIKPGSHQRKLGSRVAKGRWKGFPIYSLTLEERASCPRSCEMWFACMGNHMGQSVRYEAGEPLMRSIWADLTELQGRHPLGFVVRLHILGDFFAVEYVEFWRGCLSHFPALRVFGYSARQADDPIGQAVAKLRDGEWDRFAVRTSGAPSGPRTIVVDKAPAGRQAHTIVCPAQTGKSKCCAKCALCWSHSAREKTIAFIEH